MKCVNAFVTLAIVSSLGIVYCQSKQVATQRSSHVGSVSDIWAPVVVGRPPADACMGLVRLESGEIRYYNYSQWREGKEPLYISSLDNGLTWKEQDLAPGYIGADQRSPISGEYLRVFQFWKTVNSVDSTTVTSGPLKGTYVVRTQGGIDGGWTVTRILPGHVQGAEDSLADTISDMFRPPVFIRGGKRVLVPSQREKQYDAGPPRNGVGTLYSDDDGLTWKVSNFVTAPPHVPDDIDKGPRWQAGAVESTIVELKDGRLWMLARTSQDVLYQSFSHDGGESWEPLTPSRFYSTLTMPTMARLRDGRILLIWNSTRPLPEVERNESTRVLVGPSVNNGRSEDVFTYVDAFHAAISDDDGHNWTGFREIALDERRNDQDYAGHGGTDRGVQESQFIETTDGKIMAAIGLHPMHRVLVMFDVGWLYEKKRETHFENGLDDWSVQKFIAGVHVAHFNRKPGARLEDDPDKPGAKMLRVRRPSDPSLVTENDGAVWNFPAGKAGALTMQIRFEKGGQGGRISLLDRWVNPIDFASERYAMFNLKVAGDGSTADGLHLTPGTWHELRLEWKGVEDASTGHCEVLLDGKDTGVSLPLNRQSVNGINYVHFLSTANNEDDAGFLIESVAATVQ